MTQVIITQSYRWHNCWTVRDAETDEALHFSIDNLTRNGAFAADSVVGRATEEGWDIVGIWPQEDRDRSGDTNMDAIEGALYRAAHGAFDKIEGK